MTDNTANFIKLKTAVSKPHPLIIEAEVYEPTTPVSASSSSSSDVVNADKYKRDKLPASAVEIMRAWLDANINYPYPSERVKRCMSYQLGISLQQVNCWFVNARRRYVKKLRNNNLSPTTPVSSRYAQPRSPCPFSQNPLYSPGIYQGNTRSPYFFNRKSFEQLVPYCYSPNQESHASEAKTSALVSSKRKTSISFLLN
ncbi:hypothetical protein MP638_005322 [Amoeboaphelidium occidentale]|nr:hypothetical protein MP638_005322 [Amoeboaphelidium occidentale]